MTINTQTLSLTETGKLSIKRISSSRTNMILQRPQASDETSWNMQKFGA